MPMPTAIEPNLSPNSIFCLFIYKYFLIQNRNVHVDDERSNNVTWNNLATISLQSILLRQTSLSHASLRQSLDREWEELVPCSDIDKKLC
jgi:hypothetical protein